ncbi:AvrD family protein [Streptomyces niveus]|uniref:AvrD family protein n=1 Tax=Streptomyces niveus TaxID=193462 RepID=UPI003425D2D4
MTATASQLRYPSVDARLGERDSRFFGEGFKRVTHILTHISVLPAAGTIEATAGLSFPGRWSRKGDHHQRPHLSTIDAMLLAAQLTGLYTAHTYDHRSDGFRVLDVKLKAGASPDEDALDRFAVSANCVSSTHADGGLRTVMDCRIGSMHVAVTAAHPAAVPSVSPGRYPLPEHLPGVWNTAPYGVDHHERAQLLDDVLVDLAGLEAAATLTLTAEDNGPLTGIDLFVAALQLGQVLLYELDGGDRATSNTLWMRKTHLGLTGTGANSGRFTVRLDNTRTLHNKQGTWRTGRIAARHGGLTLACDVAHLLP